MIGIGSGVRYLGPIVVFRTREEAIAEALFIPFANESPKGGRFGRTMANPRLKMVKKKAIAKERIDFILQSIC